MKIEFQKEIGRVRETKDYILNWLSGEGSLSCLDQEPARRYCIGTLTPLSSDEQGLDDGKKDWVMKRKPDSLGFEARIQTEKQGAISLKLSIAFATYSRSIPSLDEQIKLLNESSGAGLNNEGTVHFRQKYKRLEIKVEDIEVKIQIPSRRELTDFDCSPVTTAINEALEKAANTVHQQEDCWFITDKEPLLRANALATEESYQAAWPSTERQKPKWKADITGKLWPSENGQWRLGLLLTNATEGENISHSPTFFCAKISCCLHQCKFISVPFEAAAQDYRYASTSWGKGINCVLQVVDENHAVTETAPVYEQKRTISRNNTDDSCSYARLATSEYPKALQEVELWLRNYAMTWEKDNQKYLGDSSYELREKGLSEFREEIQGFRFGMDSLLRDSRLSESFKLMNAVFAKSKHPSWRLFQLVFVVSQMPSLLAREIDEPEYLEEQKKVDVLWFATGGGKTEAYFGVILTALFFDRFRGKTRGATAWLRYPLRMLSIQQLQRLVDCIATAEEIRANHSDDRLTSGDPFSVGYYVGSKNTPNELTDPWGKDKQIKLLHDEVEKATSIDDIGFMVLQRCPYCRSSDLRLEINIEEVRIKHICNACQKIAPIYITDSEIYRYVPPVIVGTVDRLARAGQISTFGHLFGQFSHRCPKHGYCSYNTCIEEGVCDIAHSKFEKIEPIYDPCPTLLLQDELHLLKESLGTYDSHFEGFLDTFSEQIGKKLLPKRLCATATIEGYENHVSELYGQKARRFPVKGMGEHESAYTQLASETPISRLYIGILPLGSNQEEVVSQIMHGLKEYSTSHTNDTKEIVDNYDLGLAYVNEKNTAGNLRSRWDDIDDIQVLTGDKGLGEVRATISQIESDPSKKFDERLKLLVATSIISHGVDLERLNYMAFAGMPNHTSDYIQASSRVGRNHVGVVFTVFRPTNNRERNIYQHFYEYHDRLYQLVQPVPINRFSESSITRTLSAIMSACILNILSYQKNRDTALPLDKAQNFITSLQNQTITEDEIINLVKSSYGLARFALPISTQDEYAKLITRLVKDQKRVIIESEDRKTSSRMRPSPVASLREVSEQIEFHASSEYLGVHLQQKLVQGRVK